MFRSALRVIDHSSITFSIMSTLPMMDIEHLILELLERWGGISSKSNTQTNHCQFPWVCYLPTCNIERQPPCCSYDFMKMHNQSV